MEGKTEMIFCVDTQEEFAYSIVVPNWRDVRYLLRKHKGAVCVGKSKDRFPKSCGPALHKKLMKGIARGDF